MTLKPKTDNNQLKIQSKHIQIGVMVKDWKEAITKACRPLVEDGSVNNEYAQDAINREVLWSTGLRVCPLGVAIPHGETMENVNHSAIGISVLKEPVYFKEAGTENGMVKVKLVFLLAIKNPDSQLEVLSSLMRVLGNKEKLESLQSVETADRFLEIFNSNS